MPIRQVWVERKVWGPDDDYLRISLEIQLFEEDGWKEGDKVYVSYFLSDVEQTEMT